ncbi:hypothetical protein [Streptomyces sp. NPDC002922]|uniref:hypothetical protein n=1 Tax=Streptomyces sp. NPDC002922 TaxID=3154439 RepID=UPI0033A365BB
MIPPRYEDPRILSNLGAGAVSIAGTVTVELDGAHDLASRLAARYWDLDDPTRAADLAGILAEDQVRLVLHPETVNRYA